MKASQIIISKGPNQAWLVKLYINKTIEKCCIASIDLENENFEYCTMNENNICLENRTQITFQSFDERYEIPHYISVCDLANGLGTIFRETTIISLPK